MASNDFRKKLMSLEGNLLNYAFMLTSDRDMARRLLDCTTVAALEQWAEASDDATFKGWAFSVMRGVFATEFSRQRAASNEVYALKLVQESEEAYATHPEGTCMSADVTRAFASLSADHRRAAELYFAGYSVTEIASELGVSVTVVRSRVAHCRCQLRDALTA